MKISIGFAALVIATISPLAQAQMPEDNVSSDGNYNTAMGTSALFSNDISSNESPGGSNLAAGYQALYSNLNGNANVGTGYRTLYENISGNYNVAVGYNALSLNTGGGFNTAAGMGALLSSNGSNNTAVGAESLGGNPEGDVSTGSNNTAVGFMAMNHFTFGSNNTASGFETLLSDTTGNYNTASGYEALYANTTGEQNTADGVNALRYNANGDYNTASGVGALYANRSGSYNIALGYKAGYSLTTGSNNIDVGNQGMAAERDTIRIGTFNTQTAVYIAGATAAAGSAPNVAALFVNTQTGQVGIATSSERFKTGITSMGSVTARLAELRPVTFQYKSNPQGTRQYGLIAEEVAKVYPELVVRDAHGQVLSVRYDELAPMLLNEMKQQRQQFAEQLNAQAAEIRELKAAMLALQRPEHNN